MAFNLFFTTGVMVGLAGASAPLILLISMAGMIATASSLAQFAGVYPSAGSFITYITRSIGTKVAVAIGVITILGYIIAFGGIYIFVGSYIAQNVFGNPHIWGITQLTTIVCGALVVAPFTKHLALGCRAGHRRGGSGRPGLGRPAAWPAEPVRHPAVADAWIGRARCRLRAGPRRATAGCAEAGAGLAGGRPKPGRGPYPGRRPGQLSSQPGRRLKRIVFRQRVWLGEGVGSVGTGSSSR